ncbi:MAG: MFS transporter [Acidobacteriota bacterium]
MQDDKPAAAHVADTRPSLILLYTTVFLDLLGFGLILPFLPFWAETLGASGFELGLLLTVYSAAQMIGAPLWGRLSDRFGRRPVLLTSIGGACIGLILSGLAPNLVLLTIVRAGAGLFASSTSTAQAYAADVTDRSQRPKAMGMIGASIGLGFVVGPAMGAALQSLLDFSFAQAAFTAAGLASINFLSAIFFLREPARHHPQTPNAEEQGDGSTTKAWPVLVAIFLGMFAFVSMETTFAYYGGARFGLGTAGFGGVLAFVGLVLIIVQGGLIRPLAKLGVRRVAACGVALMGTALLLLPAAPTLGWTFLPLGVLAFGRGLTSPTLATILSETAGTTAHGKALGTGQSVGAAARAVGPVTAGALYDLSAALPYYVAGGLALVAALVVVILIPDSSD